MGIIDADGHVEESEQTWQYIPAALQAKRPVPVSWTEDTNWGEHNGAWLVDYKIRKYASSPSTMLRAQRRAYSIGSQEVTDVPARLADLDRAGIEQQVLFPSSWLGNLSEDLELLTAMCRSHNQFMADQCNQSGGRLFYIAVLPWCDPEAAVEEVRRVRQMGSAVGLHFRGMEWDIPLAHPMFWPIFEEAEREDLVIGMHSGNGSPTLRHLFDRVPRPKLPPGTVPHSAPPLIGGGLSSVHHGLACLLSSTVLEDFPRLRWGILETGSEWLVPEVRAASRRAGRDLPRYFREGRIYVSCEPDENLGYVMGTLGEDCLVVGSDMPHGDSFSHARPADEFIERGDLAEARLDKLLRENARAFYRI